MDVNCGIWTAEYSIRKLPPGDYYIGDPKLALKPETYATLKTTAKEFGEDAIVTRFNDDDEYNPTSHMMFFKHKLGTKRFYVEVFGYDSRVVYAGQNIDTGIQQITVDPVGNYLAIISAHLVDIDKCPGKNMVYFPEPITLSVSNYTGRIHLKSGKSREIFFDCNDQFDPAE